MAGSILIAPSVLSADFSRLGEAVAAVEAAGADLIHVDVMDGHFVPNLTVGPPVVKALKRITSLPLDVHLMISNPEASVEWYLDAGADLVTIHAEACPHLHRLIQIVKSEGRRAGVALNPATPTGTLRDVIADVDLVLVMSVNPGFGGQAFIPDAIRKVTEIAEMAKEAGATPLISVDGGINVHTAPLVAGAGASVLVAGNAVFCEPDVAVAIEAIRAAALSAIV